MRAKSASETKWGRRYGDSRRPPKINLAWSNPSSSSVREASARFWSESKSWYRATASGNIGRPRLTQDFLGLEGEDGECELPNWQSIPLGGTLDYFHDEPLFAAYYLKGGSGARIAGNIELLG